MTNDDYARNWLLLCERNDLTPDATPHQVAESLKYAGFCQAILSMQGNLGDLVKRAKKAFNQGKPATLVN